MALSTIGSYLMYSADGTTYSKLLDIKDYPDVINPPEQLQATTLSDEEHWYIPGVKDNGGNIEFTANYTASDFASVKALEGTEAHFAIWFGDNAGTPNGSNGKFSFKGFPYVAKKGGGVNEVSEMTVGVIPTTAITFAAS